VQWTGLLGRGTEHAAIILEEGDHAPGPASPRSGLSRRTPDADRLDNIMARACHTLTCPALRGACVAFSKSRSVHLWPIAGT
jgi:hypothetical protein